MLPHAPLQFGWGLRRALHKTGGLWEMTGCNPARQLDGWRRTTFPPPKAFGVGLHCGGGFSSSVQG